MKKVAILGSTGVIGSKALAVVRDYPDKFKVISLAAGHESAKLKKQVKEFKPKIVGIGEKGLLRTITNEVDLVIVAVVGRVGIEPVLKAIKLKKDIGLATKEVLVLEGEKVMTAVKKQGINLIPIDSEHSAIWQSLKAGSQKDVKNIYLTMGQGRISSMSEAEKAKVTPEEVLNRKTWEMGEKIGIDSATCINKAFELIEARWLFDLKPEQIKVVIHPEYLCHSLVEFKDGSIISEMGIPDMKRYVQYAMFYPERKLIKNIPGVNLTDKSLSFKAANLEKFPGLKLGYEALKKGKAGAKALYDADDLAVKKFIKGEIRFTEIVPMIEREMNKI